VLVEGFPAQVAGTNCWVVAPGAGQHCVVIDPGVGVGPQLDEVLARHDLRPAAVLLTHGHLDHTFSVLPVCEAKDVPAYIAAEDRAQLADPWSGMGLRPGAPLFGVEGLEFAEPDDVRLLSDGQALGIAGLAMTVLATPGHTLGSVSFDLPAQDGAADGRVVFSGDTLFAGSIGRMDLVGGSEADMARSLAGVYLPMPDETVIHPGHGPSTTMGAERRGNPYLRLIASGGSL
jgi:glyoxylase-like metal-dependent hydrolase (beta-lactamase superfamily II)